MLAQGTPPRLPPHTTVRSRAPGRQWGNTEITLTARADTQMTLTARVDTQMTLTARANPQMTLTARSPALPIPPTPTHTNVVVGEAYGQSNTYTLPGCWGLTCEAWNRLRAEGS